MLGHTYTQVEKGKFAQVQSSDDLILLAVRGAVTLRPMELGSFDWLDENLLGDDKGVPAAVWFSFSILNT